MYVRARADTLWVRLLLGFRRALQPAETATAATDPLQPRKFLSAPRHAYDETHANRLHDKVDM